RSFGSLSAINSFTVIISTRSGLEKTDPSTCRVPIHSVGTPPFVCHAPIIPEPSPLISEFPMAPLFMMGRKMIDRTPGMLYCIYRYKHIHTEGEAVGEHGRTEGVYRIL